MADHDPDLPGDADFRPLPPVVEVPLTMRCAHCPADGSRCTTCGGPSVALGLAMTIPADAQAAQHHNRLRYAELAALRLGMPNRYHQTRYRR